jgi:hypothetical protein
MIEKGEQSNATGENITRSRMRKRNDHKNLKKMKKLPGQPAGWNLAF